MTIEKLKLIAQGMGWILLIVFLAGLALIIAATALESLGILKKSGDKDE